MRGRETGTAATAGLPAAGGISARPVSYTHLRAHETVLDLVCRLLLEKKKKKKQKTDKTRTKPVQTERDREEISRQNKQYTHKKQ